MKQIPLSEPVIKGNEWKYVKECLDTGWVSSVGNFVTKFEEIVANYVKVKYAVAVSNGTAALHLSLIVAGVRPNDEVIVPTLTFIAPVNVVHYCGANPVFVDCDPKTLGMDINQVKRFLTQECESRVDGFTYNKKTGRRVIAVIPVHVFGHPVDTDPLVEICKKSNICVIEDATESLGSEYKDKKTGNLADIGCFSFNGNKIITTGGGGMIVTDNEQWAKRLRHLSTQAKKDPFEYEHDEIGYNYRLTNVLAAIGLAQMELLDSFLAQKRQNNARYRELLSGCYNIELLSEEQWAKSNYWFYTLKVPKEHKNLLIKHLLADGIQVRPIWKLIHTLSMYKDCQVVGAFNAISAYEQCINLPCSVNIKDEEIIQVAMSIKKYLSTI